MAKVSEMVVNFDKKYCPEAIEKWLESATYSRQLILDAKMHLSAVGWVFYRVEKKTNGYRELRYKSPTGKVYISLKTACKGYLEQLSSQGRGPQTAGLGMEEGKLINVEENSVIKETNKPTKRKLPEQLKQAATFEFSQPKFCPKRFNNLKEEEKWSQKTFVLRSVQSPPSLCQRNLASWLIENKAVSVLTKVYYRDKTGKPMKKGRINAAGIHCDCCLITFTLTAFEAHSGSTNHRPAANIILDDGTGRSLSDCQRQVRDSKIKTSQAAGSVEKNDDVCSVCLDAGQLICCDNCPSAFHATCIHLNHVPEGDWFCLYCRCEVCGSGSRDGILLTCQQCERKFHAVCKQLDQQPDPENNEKWFCSRSCQSIFGGLQNLIGKPISMGKNLSWTLLKSRRRCLDSDSDIDRTQDIDSKLSLAVGLMHECFQLSKDCYTGSDLIEDVILSRVSKLKRVNFSSFYTVILEDNDELISVATVRVHGDRVAEMPLIATGFSHRGRGMCRVLMAELEKNMIKFGVEKLVLPALPDLLNIWTKKFGFSRMTVEERSRFLQFTFLDFQGTIRCQKLLTT